MPHVRAICSSKALRMKTPGQLNVWVAFHSLGSTFQLGPPGTLRGLKDDCLGKALELAQLASSQERGSGGISLCEGHLELTGWKFSAAAEEVWREPFAQRSSAGGLQSPHVTRLPLPTARELRKRRVNFPSPRVPCFL